MKIIEGQVFSEERALYNATDTAVIGCRFEGAEDGESALKEGRNIEVKDCYMALRYPMWHVEKLVMDNVTMTETCRAALWYTHNLSISNSNMGGIKALRECSDISIEHTKVDSPEYGWNCRNIKISDCDITGEYAFMNSCNLSANKLIFSGKYSFQYIQNAQFANCTLRTKDAFWHSKNVTVTDSTLEGEYLAWYAENLTLINCHIKGTQPLCYCKNLKLINCTMENADLAFEYSDVEADIIGDIVSVKNVGSGYVVADNIEEVISGNNVYPINADIRIRDKRQSV